MRCYVPPVLPERRVLRLPSGSAAGLIEYGTADGSPVLYLHGTPSSAVEAFWMHAASVRHGIRMLAVDRPGYGGSSPIEPGLDVVGRRLCEVADLLGLERFGVVGFSGGAGAALGVASVAGDRVVAVHLGGGMGSIDGATRDELPTTRRLQLTAIAKSRPLFRVLFGRMGAGRRKKLEAALKIPTYAALEMLEGASAGPQLAAAESFARETPPEDLRTFVSAYAAAFEDLEGIRTDLIGISRPWPFQLSTISMPVELWHGTADDAVPITLARKLASSLPAAKLHELSGEGHFVLLTHADDVCAALA